MMRATQRDRVRFEEVLADAAAEAIDSTAKPHAREVARLLMRHGATYGRLAEVECSVELSERETARLERRQAQLERRMRELVSELGDGFSVDFSGDPRGYTVKVTLPTKAYNTWGGAESGWGVPTS